VQAVSSRKNNATLVTATGERETFDHIIFACHTDDALRILDAGSGATSEERDILGTFRWSKNDVWLHSDKSVGVILPLLFLGERWLTLRLVS
jgi:predicted NAD/FAD-binding protein